MADKSFGVKELNLLNASGTPTVTSPNNLNLNANTVAISTSATVGNNLTVTSTTNSANLNVTGIGTLTRGFATDLSVSGISTISQPSNANPHSLWDVVNNGSSAYRFTGPGQSGDENNPNIYLVRGQRYIFKVNASGHPFQLRVANGGAAYSDGVTNNGAQSGNVVINVQHDAPAQLYYQCTVHGGMVGNIYIVGGPQVISGVVTATTFVGNLTGNVTGTASANAVLTGSTNNQLVTVTGANAITGESNLTYDGNALSQTIDANDEGINITSSGAHAARFKVDTNQSGADDTIFFQSARWNGTEVASIHMRAGSDTTNKDDGRITFHTTPSGGSNTERLRITSGGLVGVGQASPTHMLHVDSSNASDSTATAFFKGRIIRFDGAASSDSPRLNFSLDGTDKAQILCHRTTVGLDIATLVAEPIKFKTNSTERLRILSDGRITTSGLDGNTDITTTGTGDTYDGMIFGGVQQPLRVTRTSACTVFLNRNGSGGNIQEWRYGGSIVGYVANNSNSFPSDRNFKKNISNLSLGLDLVNKLQPVSYNHKFDADSDPVMYGLVAQDFEKALSDVGVTQNAAAILKYEATDDEKQSDYFLDYSKLTPILINAVKELTTKIETLEAKVAALEGS